MTLHMQTTFLLERRLFLVFALSPMPAPESRPSGVLSMAGRSMPRNTDTTEGMRTGGSETARHTYPGETPGFSRAQREPTWDHPPPAHSFRQEHAKRFNDRPSGDQVEHNETPSSGFSRCEYSGSKDSDVVSEPTPNHDMFGSMAPCWRLLERAQAYMDKVWTL